MNPLYYILPLAAFLLLALLLRTNRRRVPPATHPGRLCGLCHKPLLYDESGICGPCAVDQDNGHWGDELPPLPVPRQEKEAARLREAAEEEVTPAFVFRELPARKGREHFGEGVSIDPRDDGYSGKFMGPVEKAWSGGACPRCHVLHRKGFKPSHHKACPVCGTVDDMTIPDSLVEDGKFPCEKSNQPNK